MHVYQFCCEESRVGALRLKCCRRDKEEEGDPNGFLAGGGGKFLSYAADYVILLRLEIGPHVWYVLHFINVLVFFFHRIHTDTAYHVC